MDVFINSGPGFVDFCLSLFALCAVIIRFLSLRHGKNVEIEFGGSHGTTEGNFLSDIYQKRN